MKTDEVADLQLQDPLFNRIANDKTVYLDRFRLTDPMRSICRLILYRHHQLDPDSEMVGESDMPVAVFHARSREMTLLAAVRFKPTIHGEVFLVL